MASVHINSLEQFLLHSDHARVPIRFQISVPVSIPGGMFVKLSALAVLGAAQAQLENAG